jgi:AraC family transcriptional regulator of adaptative response / DNA-3-methyladenine glycosylase II
MPSMTLDPDACYRALLAHDARFDGRVYVGVSSTGIYCRPVCRVRTPRRENCRFFASAAAAESRGFRPCLRCRPELAPGHASIDAGSRLAAGAVDLIEGGVLDDEGMAGLASRVGVSDRHLRRLFETEFGVSPIAYAQTHRLLLAKQLLTDSSLPVTEIAHASGFASVRRFNALFASRYRMSPSRLRRAAKPGAVDGLAFELAYRPPYAFDAVLAFLGARAIDGVESVSGRTYTRTLELARGGDVHAGRIAVSHLPRRGALRVVLSPALARVVPAVLARVRHLFDLAADPVEIAAALGPLAAGHEGLRLPGAVDGFELATRAIVGQQVSVKAARTLLGRLAAAAGTSLDDGLPGPALRFPSAAVIAAMPVADLARIGLVRTRAEALRRLAHEVAGGALRLDPGAEVEPTLAALVALPGVGPWTAHYIAMRALRWPDAFLAGDLIVRRQLGVRTAAEAERASAAWRPWRAYAVMHLWRRST